MFLCVPILLLVSRFLFALRFSGTAIHWLFLVSISFDRSFSHLLLPSCHLVIIVFPALFFLRVFFCFLFVRFLYDYILLVLVYRRLSTLKSGFSYFLCSVYRVCSLDSYLFNQILFSKYFVCFILIRRKDL